MKEELCRLGVLVAVPAAVRPLPLDEALDQFRGAVVRKAQAQGRPDGIALLRGAAARPAVDHPT